MKFLCRILKQNLVRISIKIQSVKKGRKKMFKCKISGVRKKKKLKEGFREKKSKYFRWKFLLSSCSLVNLQVKVMGENGEDFQNIFREGVLKLKL